MKHNIFKIRKLGDPTDTKELSESEVQQRKPAQIDTLKASIQATNQKMLELMTMFEGFMKSAIQNSTTPTPNPLTNRQNEAGKAEKEVRDRHIEIPLPNTDTVTVEQTQKWMTEVCISAFSASFHYYLTQQMTFQQTKVFCSENVLQNLLKFTEKYKLTHKQIQNLNMHIGSKVLQYLQKKYPLTQSNDVNKALQKEVQQTNHLDFLTNDFLYSFGIMFKYNPDGNYNDMIMRVINKAIQIAQQPSFMPNTQEKEKKRNEQETNFTDFQSFMSNLFENVYDEEWMMGSRAKADRTDSQATYIAKKVSAQAQKFKYEEKVKEYTHYLIGRKISQNTLPYTEQEIKGKNLIIKSPAILRILTKWCQQLWQKFESETYFTSKTESIQLQNPQMINPFFKWMKTSIDKRVSAEKVEILKFKAQLDGNSYNQQSQFFLKHLQEDNITSIPKYQKASGKFASQMVKNLHSYITLYLNRLIHGLLTVSKNFYQKQIDKSWDDWQSPPNLITFKTGDLIRCKMSSKQKQIIKLFKEIKHISNVNPKKMKIVRIKNRLKQGTNDILMNIKFNNLIICEIQLEVINKSKTKFIQCSNSFSHYIYEMKRSIFGPISELCNIWNNFEARAQQYQELISHSKDLMAIGVHCVEENYEHQFEKFDLPFQCHFCKKLYYHNNYIIPNKQCQHCKTYKCVKCQIDSMEDPELKKNIFKSRKYASLSQSSKKHKQRSIPTAGICVKIQSTSINIEVFKLTKYEGKTWLLGQRDGQLYNIKKINSSKDSDQFLDNYCIFAILSNTQQLIKATDKMAQNFSVQQYVKDSYKQQKQVLILTQNRFTVPEMINLMKIDGGFERNKRKIKRIQFASNYLSDISYFSCFESLTALNLDFNNFQDMLGIINFKLLEKLEMRDNSKLSTFNKQVCELTRLQEIKINNCTIKQLPDNIGDLTLLQILKMDKNQLRELPDSICNIINLKELSLFANSITKLPEQIGKIVNLRKLIMSKNKLVSIPDSIGQMVGLEILDLSNNMITSLPQTMIYLSRLETLRLEGNKLEAIPSGLLSNEFLKTLSLRSNQIKVLPNSFNSCKSLQTLQLQMNQIEQLPSSLGQCLNLQNLLLEKNKLKSIPSSLGKCKKLSSVIQLGNNELTEIPSFIFNMESVTKLNVSFNKITTIPGSIGRLEDLTQLIISNNHIKQLIPQLTQLQNIQKWAFQSNQLQKIPPFFKDIKIKGNNPISIGKLFQQNNIKQIQSTQFFDMMKLDIALTLNELEAIPMGLINNKQHIKAINFSNNNIKYIPEDIALFESLTDLNLSNNQIKIVPKVLEQLTKMQPNKLVLDGNPIEQIDCLEYCLKFGTNITKNIAKQFNKDPSIRPQQPIPDNIEDENEDDQQ